MKRGKTGIRTFAVRGANDLLIDTSILVAMMVEGHPSRAEARGVVASGASYVIAAHSLAEFYNTVTKPRHYGWSPSDAATAVSALTSQCEVKTLTAIQSVSAVLGFSRIGGKGALIYDFLIGYHAVAHSIDTIVTLNERDFRTLFPRLTILTPAQYLETL